MWSSVVIVVHLLEGWTCVVQRWWAADLSGSRSSTCSSTGASELARKFSSCGILHPEEIYCPAQSLKRTFVSVLILSLIFSSSSSSLVLLTLTLTCLSKLRWCLLVGIYIEVLLHSWSS